MTTNREGWLTQYQLEGLGHEADEVERMKDTRGRVMLTPATARRLCRMALAALEQEACPECGRGVFMHKCTQEHHWLPKGEA